MLVRRLGKSNVIAIDVTSSVPAKAARIANQVADAYLASKAIGMETENVKAIGWLEDQIASLRGELAGIEGQIIQEKSKSGITPTHHQSSIALRTAALAEQLAAAKANTARAIAEYGGLEHKTGGESEADKVTLISNAVLSELRSLEVVVIRRLSELSKEYGPRHPLRLAMETELLGVRERIQEEGNRVLHDRRHEIAIMKARETELEEQLSALKNKTINEQHALLDISDLQSRASTEKARLESLLKRHRELLEESHILKAEGQIMSPAYAPTWPTHPKPFLTSLIAACFGLFLSSIGVFLTERWIADFGFKTLDELNDFGLKPLGVVPDLKLRDSAGSAIEDYIIAQPLSSQAEAFRRLRTRLYQGTGDPSLRGSLSVMITSSLPLEGKTATAIALARQAAEAGISTLLIDADLRRPRIHDVLGVSVGNGLADLLAGTHYAEECIIADHLTPLHVLPAGSCNENPSDLIRKERMRAFFAVFEQAYDLILIDTPPIGAVSDCLLLGQHAKKTIYVARWRSTNKSTILSGVQELAEAHINVDGVILSRVNGIEHMKYGHVDFGQFYGHYHNRHLEEAS